MDVMHRGWDELGADDLPATSAFIIPGDDPFDQHAVRPSMGDHRPVVHIQETGPAVHPQMYQANVLDGVYLPRDTPTPDAYASEQTAEVQNYYSQAETQQQQQYPMPFSCETGVTASKHIPQYDPTASISYSPNVPNVRGAYRPQERGVPWATEPDAIPQSHGPAVSPGLHASLTRQVDSPTSARFQTMHPGAPLDSSPKAHQALKPMYDVHSSPDQISRPAWGAPPSSARDSPHRGQGGLGGTGPGSLPPEVLRGAYLSHDIHLHQSPAMTGPRYGSNQPGAPCGPASDDPAAQMYLRTLEQSNHELKQKVNELQRQLGEAHKRGMGEKEAVKDKLQTLLDETEVRLKACEHRLELTSRQVDALQGELHGLHELLKKERDTSASLRDESVRWQEECKELRKEMDLLTKKLHTVSEEERRLSFEANGLRRELQLAEDNLHKARVDANEVKDQLKQYKKDASNNMDIASRATAGSDNLQQQLQALKRQCIELDMKNRHLMTDIGMSKEDAHQARAELENMRSFYLNQQRAPAGFSARVPVQQLTGPSQPGEPDRWAEPRQDPVVESSHLPSSAAEMAFSHSSPHQLSSVNTGGGPDHMWELMSNVGRDMDQNKDSRGVHPTHPGSAYLQGGAGGGPARSGSDNYFSHQQEPPRAHPQRGDAYMGRSPGPPERVPALEGPNPYAAADSIADRLAALKLQSEIIRGRRELEQPDSRAHQLDAPGYSSQGVTSGDYKKQRGIPQPQMDPRGGPDQSDRMQAYGSKPSNSMSTPAHGADLPFGTAITLQEMVSRSRHLEDKLLELCKEKGALEAEFARFPLGAGRSLKERERKFLVEQRLEAINRDISQHRLMLKRINKGK